MSNDLTGKDPGIRSGNKTQACRFFLLEQLWWRLSRLFSEESLEMILQVQFKKRLKIALLISICSRVTLPQQGNAYLDLHYFIKMVRVSCVNS